MENINESIARALQSGRPSVGSVGPLTARDCMTKSLVVFRKSQTVRDAIQILLHRRISGGPVIDDDDRLLGMVSEMDCLQALASGAYDNEPFELSRLVGEVMRTDCITIEPSADVYTMVQLFAEHAIRRLPVVAEQRVVGQVSRRDILTAIEHRY